MDKKLLIYNMYDQGKEILERLKDKYQYLIYEADNYSLGHKVAYLIGESDNDKIKEGDFKPVDIYFLMIHGFDDEELNSFLLDLRENKLSLPNKCVSTENNLSWSLYELLIENKEESELMPLLIGLQKIYKVGSSLIGEGNKDENLINQINKIALVLNGKKFEKESLKNLYNESAKIINEFLQ